MPCRYYDDLIIAKLKRWLPDKSNLRVLKPDESKRLFELTADDNADGEFKLPFIAVSRNNDIELLSNIKNLKSFDGLRLYTEEEKALREKAAKLSGKEKEEVLKQLEKYTNQTLVFNVIPIRIQYNLDIYTKTMDEMDEYVRQFLFKLINNPVLKVEIPYNNSAICHIANIRVLNTVSDTSAISERIFSGQFSRYTIQLEIQDAFLFSLPYKKNWKLYATDTDLLDEDEKSCFELEVSKTISQSGEIEPLDDVIFKKEDKNQ